MSSSKSRNNSNANIVVAGSIYDAVAVPMDPLEKTPAHTSNSGALKLGTIDARPAETAPFPEQSLSQPSNDAIENPTISSGGGGSSSTYTNNHTEQQPPAIGAYASFLAVAVLVSTVSLLVLLRAVRRIRNERRKERKMSREVHKYLGNFDVDQLELRSKSIGGLQGKFKNITVTVAKHDDGPARTETDAFFTDDSLRTRNSICVDELRDIDLEKGGPDDDNYDGDCHEEELLVDDDDEDNSCSETDIYLVADDDVFAAI